MGKGLTGLRSSQRKHLPYCRTGIISANLTEKISKKVICYKYIADYGSEYI